LAVLQALFRCAFLASGHAVSSTTTAARPAEVGSGSCMLHSAAVLQREGVTTRDDEPDVLADESGSSAPLPAVISVKLTAERGDSDGGFIQEDRRHDEEEPHFRDVADALEDWRSTKKHWTILQTDQRGRIRDTQQPAAGADPAGETAPGEPVVSTAPAATEVAKDAAADQWHQAEERGDAGVAHETLGHGGAGNAGGGSKKDVAVAEGMMLMGTVAFVMSMFYLVNFPDRDIQQETWSAMSSTVSIFCAVLLFTCIKDVMVYGMGESSGHHHAPPDQRSLMISFGRLAVMAAALNALMASLRTGGMLLKAVGLIGSHIISFACIDAFGNLQQLEPFRSSLQLCCVAVLIALVVMISIASGASALRARLDSSDWEEFREECAEGEIEAFSLTAGFLVSHLVRFSIVGQLAPLHGAPKGKTQSEVNTLLLWSVVFATLVVALGFLHSHLARRNADPMVKGATNLALEVSSMSMAWCFLAWGQWEFWSSTDGAGVGEGDKMTARMVMALLSSLLVFACIFAVDKAADFNMPEFRPLADAFVLVMALSWEAAFDRAVQGIGEEFEGNQKLWMETGLSIALCAVVLPAWMLYVLPRAEEAKEESSCLSEDGKSM